jgi:heat shock protein HslJ
MLRRKAPKDELMHDAVMRLMTICTMVCAFACSGCNSQDARTALVLSLRETKWQLTASSDAALDPAKFAVTADFGEMDISGRSAVNRYGCPYSVGSDGALTVGALKSTRMAGPEDAMRAEAAYFDLLGKARRCSVNGSNLILLDGSNQQILTFTAR